MNIIPILQSSFFFLKFVQSDRPIITHIDIYKTLCQNLNAVAQGKLLTMF